MTRPRVVAGSVPAAFCLTLAASVRADNAHVDIQLEKLIFAERHGLTILNEQQIDTNYLYTAHFENNNGKHLGFSMALVHNGPKREVVRRVRVASAYQNLETSRMGLLGTGLAAFAGFARKVNRRRKN